MKNKPELRDETDRKMHPKVVPVYTEMFNRALKRLNDSTFDRVEVKELDHVWDEGIKLTLRLILRRQSPFHQIEEQFEYYHYRFCLHQFHDI